MFLFIYLICHTSLTFSKNFLVKQVYVLNNLIITYTCNAYNIQQFVFDSGGEITYCKVKENILFKSYTTFQHKNNLLIKV